MISPREFLFTSLSLSVLVVLPSPPMQAQQKLASGFYYPVDAPDSRLHNLIVGGHFMGPDNSVVDPQTGRHGNYFPGDYHNAMDILTSHGSPVYAIADGYFDFISPGGWSNGGTVNVAVVINHTTSTGQQFRALYGHLEQSTVNTKMSRNSFIHAGQLLGQVGTWVSRTENGITYYANHLHFGVNLSSPSQTLILDQPHGIGYGIISMTHWPTQYNWTDPVYFVETNCPSGTYSCLVNDLFARSDMKQYMLGTIDNALSTDDVNFGFSYQDQLFEYRYEWFYKQVNNQWQYFLAYQASLISNRSVRWVHYENWQTKQFSAWTQLYRWMAP